MERNYKVIAHSSGPWKEHKYVKKVGDDYYYPAGYENGRTVGSSESSNTKQISKEEHEKMRKTALENYRAKKAEMSSKNDGGSTGSATASISKKSGSKGKSSKEKSTFKKEKVPKSGSSKSSKEKAAKEKTGTENAEKTTKEKTPKEQVEKIKRQADFAKAKENAKTEEEAIKEAVSLGANDSMSSEKNDDGTYTVTVTYEDGSTQKFYLSKNRELMKKDPKVEKKEDELKHTVTFIKSYHGSYRMRNTINKEKLKCH